VRISAKTDYAVRAAVELAAHSDDHPLKSERISQAQGIPLRFLENILVQLRQGGIVVSRRGAEGGYRLAEPADQITVADVIRAIDGPLAAVSGERPEKLAFEGTAEPLRDVWVAVRASLRDVLEHVTLADLASGALPEAVRARTADPDAWLTR
jgi:Rrf2 family protein